VIAEFHWVGGLDLVMIIEALEDDEIIASDFVEKVEGMMEEDDAEIPRGRFEFPELLLAEIACRKTLQWRLRTTPEMFANLGPSSFARRSV
jgi:hypothetical protein